MDPRVAKKLAAAAERLRGQPGFPKRVGRPRKPTAKERAAEQQRRAAQEVATLDERLLVGTKTVARLLNISNSTVRVLAERGDLPRVTLPHVDRFLFAVEDIRKLIARSRAHMNGGHPTE
jgi:hypothetical protein